ACRHRRAHLRSRSPAGGGRNARRRPPGPHLPGRDQLISRRQLLAALGGTAVGTALGSCTKGERSSDEIRIGALCELSGPSSTIGSQQALGIQFAADEINRTGGIVGKGPGVGGRPVRLIV